MKSRPLVVTAVFATAALAGPPAKVDQPLLDKGKAAFAVNCGACHGEKGMGDGVAAASLNPKPRNFTAEPLKFGETPEAVFKTVSTGVPNSAMVAFAHLPEDDRWALAHWVLELRKAARPAAAAPAPAGKKPKK